ncbi:alpha-glucuronidase family glycosyl hydrolase [Asticcacaulis sp. EMRT-3]|uniref:alpha-glucuronidase family glycosyl hydrolase n=1 Tax=Asticcacaulis sp. EMRT-3 TaxID=3040349 RepID=UPI0024AF4F34|nr:alpha-glucuronidase family glycosyl hydrolase [Asticcacaulis sp. EMRT-3]MDI7776450.1 alpha-glucuronidase family glycosyl hydrolase [Asticcacaulis sp. EMRT-3]
MKFRIFVSLALMLFSASAAAQAATLPPEDGYALWLRYQPVAASYAATAPHATAIIGGDTPTLQAAESELERGIKGLLGQDIAMSTAVTDGALVLGTPAESSLIKSLNLPLQALGDEGFLIRDLKLDGHDVTVIAANSDTGVLYGAFRYLKLIQTESSLDHLDLSDAPKIKLRLLNHWDNLDGHVERGYAGNSIFDWWRLPDLHDPRLTDYARANASIGINGTVINNVNATPLVLDDRHIAKAAAIADALRPYGMKVYLSVNFASPEALGGLKTADPLNPQVIAWWKERTEAVYKAIPDFGGYLVKASSEGQPGPGDFGRSHADGANMLARLLKPHGGVVMWRAFVYASQNPEDRFKQAYDEFKPLDGKFDDNVIIQIKNGPIDFQPREPFSPLFGALKKTHEMMEVEITKEYVGQATHLVYLGTMWQEALQADTWQQGKGTTVAKVVDGQVYHDDLTAMAGVSNIGADRNWTGSDFDQANWYAYGRLAWNPQADAQAIATDWVKMTFSNDPAFVAPVVKMMMGSREAMVDYMTPLGLHHQMATGHHYGPGPWVCNLARPEWNPCYYSKADVNGIGFDRTKTGSDALSQYAPEVAAQWNDPKTTDPRYLLWFHHVPWTFVSADGKPLWPDMIAHYDAGVDYVHAMQATWAGLKSYVDPQRFQAVSDNLRIQAREAKWWRDASIAYFQSVNHLPLPAGVAAPEKSLSYYESLQFPNAPGQGE